MPLISSTRSSAGYFSLLACGPRRALDEVALAQREAAHLRRRHVDVLRAGQVAAGAQEAVALVAEVEQALDRRSGRPGTRAGDGSPPGCSCPPRPRRRRRPRRLPSPNDWRSSSGSMRVALARRGRRRRVAVVARTVVRDRCRGFGRLAARRSDGSSAAGRSLGRGAPGRRVAVARHVARRGSPRRRRPSRRRRAPPPRPRARRWGRRRPGTPGRADAALRASSPFAVGRGLGRARPLPPLAASRMASMRSALRMRVAAFTPIAPAMAWSSSRSLPSSTDRSICCSGLMCFSLGPPGRCTRRAFRGSGDGHGCQDRR